MSAQQSATATEGNRYSLPSILAGLLGVAALFLSGAPLVAILMAAAAVVLALHARRLIKRDPGMRGFLLSLVGFLTGLWVLVVTGIPYLLVTAAIALI